MKQRILPHLLGVSLFVIFAASSSSADNASYPEISDKRCTSCEPCGGGLSCFEFAGIGERCAKPNPCSYFHCSDNKGCMVAWKEIAIMCPDGTTKGVSPTVSCQCLGPDCHVEGGDSVVSHEISTGETRVETPSKRPGLQGQTSGHVRGSPGVSGGASVQTEPRRHHRRR